MKVRMSWCHSPGTHKMIRSKHKGTLGMVAILRNIVLGGMAGAGIASLYSLYALMLFVSNGSGAFADVDSTLGQVVASYYIGWTLAGSVIGAIRPILQWRVGAAVAGFVGASAVFATVQYVDTRFEPVDVGAIVVPALLLGPVVGVIMWWMERRIDPFGRHRS